MTDRSDTTTVYVTSHPVRVLHTDRDCTHLQRGDTNPRETKRNRYPNRDLCQRCQRDTSEPDTRTPFKQGRVGNEQEPVDMTCPWPDCGGDVERVPKGNSDGEYRCHACSRRPSDMPEDTPKWAMP